MISPASSDKRVSAHSRRALLRQFWFLPAACVLFFLFFLPVSLFSVFGPDADPVLTTGGIYHLFAQDSQPPLALGPAVMGVVSALLLFGFLFRARSAAAYFSLGVSRTRLFRQRFLFGLLGPAAGVLLGVAASFSINAAALGVCLRLVANSLYLAVMLFAAVLVPYTFCALVCTLCGTLLESVVYTGVLLGAPHLLGLAAGSLCRALLPGSPFDASSSPIASSTGYSFSNDWLPGYTSCLCEQSDVLAPLCSQPNMCPAWAHFPGAKPPTGLASIGGCPCSGWGIAVGAALLAWRLFLRRPGELSGFAGRCRALGTGTAVLLGMTAFALLLFANLPVWLLLLLAALAFTLVWGISCLAAFRGLRRIRGSLLSLPISLGALLTASVILAAGGFGFSSRLPAAADVESVEITYRGNVQYISAYRVMGSNFVAPLLVESPEDVETVLSLHRELIALGRPTVTGRAGMSYGDTAIAQPIALRYSLKNGKRMIRIYDHITLGLEEKLLALDTTDAFREQLENRVREAVNTSVYLHTDTFVDTYSWGETAEELPLEAADRAALADALLADFASQSLDDRYFPDRPAKAVLTFGASLNAHTLTTVLLTDAFSHTIAYLEERVLLPVAPDPVVFEGGTLYYCDPAVLTDAQDLYLQNLRPYIVPYSLKNKAVPTLELDAVQVNALLPALRHSFYASRPVVIAELVYLAPDSDGKIQPQHLYRVLPLEDLPDSLREPLMG